MKSNLSKALLLALCMSAAAAVAAVARPTQKLVDTLPQLRLEHAVPMQFGAWVTDTQSVAGVVNPQQTTLLNKLYSQILTRTYVDRDGYRIMLSIAYGEDQRDANQLHYPEICYPAQGFQLISKTTGTLHFNGASIPVKKLETSLSNTRFEPVLYWTTVGDQAVIGGAEKKLAEMHYGLKGMIPDGLLFRVSSIDRDSEGAFKRQEAFIRDLLGVLNPADRKRIAGL